MPSFVVSQKGDGTNYIGDPNQQYGCGLVGGCQNAPETLSIPSQINNVYVSEIGGYSFRKCYNIKYLTIEEGFISTRTYSFCQCENLIEVTLPSSLELLGGGTFENCFALQTVHFPTISNLKHIEPYCFNECYQIDNIIISSSVRQIDGNIFSDIPIGLKIFSYFKRENTDSTIFRNTTNVSVYVPKNGPKLFGNITTIRILQPNQRCTKFESKLRFLFHVLFFTSLFFSE